MSLIGDGTHETQGESRPARSSHTASGGTLPGQLDHKI